MLISEEYRELNRELHGRDIRFGRGGKQWVKWVLPKLSDCKDVLDYGCGKGSFKRILSKRVDIPIREYDPAIPGKATRPEPADFVVCTDVLEHIEPTSLEHVIEELWRLTRKKAFITVSNKLDKLVLADGRNPHLIVEDADWWEDRLRGWFDILEQRRSKGDVKFLLIPGEPS